MKLKGQTIGITHHGYKVFALNPAEAFPLENHKGGEISVDEESKTMFVEGTFAHLYGTESIMKACNSYPLRG
jgi:hypothetical protein